MAIERRQRVAVWAGAVLLIVLVALVPVWLGWDRGPQEPAAAPTPADETAPTAPTPGSPEPTAGTATPTDAPTPTPTLTPPPTPAPLPEPDPGTVEALAGTATATDPTGDVLDAGGEPVTEPAEAADLVEVVLTGDDEALTVTWTVAGEVPQAADSLLWSVDLWSGDELAATITAQLVGPRQVAGILDWSSGEQAVLEEGFAIDGSSVTVRAPLERMPALEAPLTWQALGQLDGGLEDRAPDVERAPFPDEGRSTNPR